MRTSLHSLTALAMIGADSKCLCDILIKWLKDAPRHNGIRDLYGVCNGYQTFTAINFIQDLSVFAYEGLKAIDEQTGLFSALAEKHGEDFIVNLKKIRDSIHICNKHGSFEKKANRILVRLNEKFTQNFNISLYYRIKNEKAFLLGTNLSYFHISNDFDQKDWLFGANEHKYAEFIASAVNSLQDSLIWCIEKPSNPFVDSVLDDVRIEAFDYTIEAIVDRMKMKLPTCVRLLLMHTYISFINLLFDDILYADNYIDQPLWLCFFAKLYSIKYDEVLDSFDNLLEYADEQEKGKIIDLLEFKGFDRKISLKEFAKKLRNMIHYGLKGYPLIRYGDNMVVDVERVYLDIVGLATMDQFKEFYLALRLDMKLMELRFRNFFGMDNDVSQIARELAKGGRPIDLPID